MLQSTMRISFSLDHAENVRIEVEDDNITLKEEFGNRIDVYLTPAQQMELAQKIINKHGRGELNGNQSLATGRTA